LKYKDNISREEMEKIESYLDNTMSPLDKSQFEQELQSNPELLAKTEEIRLLQIGILEAILEKKLKTYHEPTAKMVTMKSSPKKWLIAASTIGILIIAGWFLFLKKSPIEEAYASYFRPDPGLPTTMSNSNAYEFEKAMIDYKNGDYQQAIDSWKNQTKSDTLTYFIGLAHQSLGNNKEAIAELTTIANDPKKVFHKDACWYLGLALLKEKELTKAIGYIEKSEYPQKEALLKAIKELQ
jgi:tetratricopeptide (TPR) repeat protein